MQLKGVILAAGKGTRIYPFSEKYPKPILPIANKPLMQYQIELMASIGIEVIRKRLVAAMAGLVVLG